jgi:hypothetical protein
LYLKAKRHLPKAEGAWLLQQCIQGIAKAGITGCFICFTDNLYNRQVKKWCYLLWRYVVIWHYTKAALYYLFYDLFRKWEPNFFVLVNKYKMLPPNISIPFIK